MALLTFKSKEEFLAFTEKENKLKQPEAPKAVPVAHKANVGIPTFAQPAAARKSATPKPQQQPQYTGRRPVVRCVECKHLSKDRQCVVNGWEPSHPDRTRLCWDYAALLG